jgi:hypothetical protein
MLLLLLQLRLAHWSVEHGFQAYHGLVLKCSRSIWHVPSCSGQHWHHGLVLGRCSSVQHAVTTTCECLKAKSANDQQVLSTGLVQWLLLLLLLLQRSVAQWSVEHGYQES